MKPILTVKCWGVLGATLMSFYTPCVHAAWTDVSPAGTEQCVSAGVNNNDTVIQNCESASGTHVAYVLLNGATTQLAPLPSTPGGTPVVVFGINNAASGHETIVGASADGNNVSQAVRWTSNAPGSPTQLMPLLGGVKTQATAVNDDGGIVGDSVDGNETAMPVYWSPGSSTPTPLLPLPGQLPTNCVAVDINNRSAVIGNCPAGALGGGKILPVLWSTPLATPIRLPVPSGASDCAVSEINDNSQILGGCTYASDSIRTVVWGPGGAGPTVLLTVNGTAVLKSVGASLNDAGWVAVNYEQNGTGFTEPAVWDPTRSDATSITLPAGAVHGTVSAIGNNGKLVGNFETPRGDTHPFHVEANSTTAVDDGSPAGGPNAWVTALSRNGMYEAGAAENGTQALQAEVQAVP